MRILVDMDEIVADLLGKWLRVYNYEWGDSVLISDLVSYDIHKVVDIDCGRGVYHIIEREGFFRDLRPLPGAVCGVESLIAMGHDVWFCSSPCGADSAKCKIQWLEEHFGMNEDELILCNAKWLVHADVIIDDNPETLQRWPKETGGRAIGIAYPYNEHLRHSVALLADNYQNTAAAWKSIIDYVRNM